ncbi:hypothetical protein PIB30_022652 [Stylosanthes scabra]|uniref:Uncharacterized protein n=1 Tax=Stylosanthes scabra TaxID=79078 RepID=A0ABU6UCI8_9FABA|nr:hypothetical protein [Stylosanthes scabra]
MQSCLNAIPTRVTPEMNQCLMAEVTEQEVKEADSQWGSKGTRTGWAEQTFLSEPLDRHKKKRVYCWTIRGRARVMITHRAAGFIRVGPVRCESIT